LGGYYEFSDSHLRWSDRVRLGVRNLESTKDHKRGDLDADSGYDASVCASRDFAF